MTDERVARAGLSRICEPGDLRVADALAQVTAVQLYEDTLAQAREIGRDAAERLRDHDPERELAQAAARGIRFVIPGDDEWPACLDDLADAPVVQERGGPPVGLWVRGPVRLDEVTGSVAVVGARAATTYGEDVAREIGAGLARAGRWVVSGAAFGIDQAAHRGALAMRGTSVAVLACGVDRAYPVAHHALLEHLATTGAVMAEVPPGCAPMRMRFIARNRLIAALTTGTVVVEAALRSGALNTANYAAGLNRHVMGVPGPVTSAQSQGVHHLVRRGGASLVTGADDVLDLVGEAGEHLVDVPRGPDRPRDHLRANHHRVLEAVPVARAAPLDSIAATAGLRIRETQTALTYLSERDFVRRTPQGWRLGERALVDVPESRA